MDSSTKQSTNAEADKSDGLSSQLLADFFERNFSLLDQDHNKYVSRKEMTAALLNNSLTAGDARVGESVIENLHSLELQSNDEWGTENNGVSRADAKVFEKNRKLDPNNAVASKMDQSLNADEHNSERFLTLLNIYKPHIDDDKSGTLSKLELEHYALASKDSNGAKSVAKFLAQHFGSLNEIGSPNSSGSYKNILAGDGNKASLGANELATLADVLRPEEQFRDKLWAIHNANVRSGSEMGKQGRTIIGRGDSGIATVIGSAIELAGSVQADDSGKFEQLVKDFQQRKSMVESWKFFK